MEFFVLLVQLLRLPLFNSHALNVNNISYTSKMSYHNFLVILQVSNLLYVDQPTGTGFSYSSDRRDIRHNEEGVSNDLYDFLQVCFLLLSVIFQS